MNQTPSIDQKNLYCLQLCSLSYIEDVANNLLDLIPATLKDKTLKIKIVVENFAKEQTLKELSLSNKYDLLGIYKKTDAFVVKDLEIQEDVIFLFRAAIIRYSQEFQETIEEVVYQVMLHEMAHHFDITPQHLRRLIEKKEG